MNSKLYVGNLAFSTNDASLRAAFEPFGTVSDVFIAMDRTTGRPRGFGFVTFANAEESKVAMDKLNGAQVDGRAITVKEALSKEETGGSTPRRTFTSPDRKAGAFHARGNRR